MKPNQEIKIYKLHSGLTIEQEIDWQRNVSKFTLYNYKKAINTTTVTNDFGIEEFLAHCIDFLYWQNSKSPLSTSIEGKTFHNPNFR